jgi:type IV pilus assembly protein PilQ
MKSPKQGKRVARWGLVGAIIFLIMGCATRGTVEPLSMPQAIPQNLVKKMTIEDSVDGKRIIIEGETAFPYTFFKLIPQPLSLKVDIPQTALTPEAAAPITVGDGIIQQITATQVDGDVEVSIGLNKLVRYQVQKEGNILAIVVGKQSPLLAEKAGKQEEKKILAETPPAVKEEGIVKKELPPAKRLVDISVDTSQKDSVTVQLKADGQLGDYNSFDLQKPTRLVIDLWKIKRRFSKKAISVSSSYLKRVRLGDYPNKIRVVLDIPSKAIPNHRVDRIGNTLIIVLGKKGAVTALAPAVPPQPQAIEKAAARGEEGVSPLLAPLTGELTGIDFKQLEDKSRIIVSTSAKATYHIAKGAADTVVLDVQGMMVPPKLRRPLDTHEFSSPVLMITSLNVAVGAEQGTQVVVKLRKMVAFDVKQENDRIYVDFERTEEFKGEKPKPVEVVTVKKPPVEKASEAPAEVKEKEEIAKKEEAAPPSPKAAPTVSASAEGTQQKVYTGKKISLDFKDADIDNILRLFAEVSNLNIIASGDVKGTVTVRLVDVPWDQAFDIVLQANNLGAERIGNVIRIVPLERLSAEKKMRAEAVKATEEVEPLVTEVIPINYGSVKDIGDRGIKPILSSRGKVVVDERTNTLIVTDIRSNVEKAKQLVRTLDAQTPQVLIQGQVIEANLDFSRELGISWGGSFATADQSGSLTASGATSSTGNFVVDIPAATGTGAGGAIQFLMANLQNTKSLQVKISALESKGEGRIISSPRLTTLDNTEASIEQGLRIPYLKLTAEGVPTTDFIEANLKLTVTPHVTADGYIRMELDIKKDSPDNSVVVEGVPSIDKKEVKTEVLVKNGEVVVIGGIYTYTKTGPTIAAVPLFYKIPLLGWLFQKKTKSDNKKELLIFIAPNIVQPRRIATP